MGYILTGAIFLLATIAGWITHIVVCIQEGEFLFMIVGAFIAPVAILHGWATWFGYNWF